MSFKIENGVLKKYIAEDGETAVTIPDSVMRIDGWAFYGCSSLKEVTIPDSVTSIDIRAFEFCSNLKEVTIPDSVKSIGDYAFYGCSNLKKVTIPDSVTSIGKAAFGECLSLEKVTIKDVTFNPDFNKLSKDYNKAIEMLETKDFSAKIYTSLKNAMIIGHFIKTGDEDAEAFIKKGTLRMFKWLIDEEDIPTIYALINTHKFVNVKNIDKLFEHTNQKNNAELKLIFMNYKHENFGYITPKKLKI